VCFSRRDESGAPRGGGGTFWGINKRTGVAEVDVRVTNKQKAREESEARV